MIDYLIKSGICLVILFAVYRFFLEKEKMHRFNRFFLLFSLAFGLIVPFITLEVAPDVLQPVEFSKSDKTIVTGTVVGSETIPVNQKIQNNPEANAYTAPDYQAIIFMIYVLATGLLLSRFLLNVVKIISKILRYPRIQSQDAAIVLVKERVAPHSFLNYIFLNENAWLKKDIEEEIVIHEFTHVRQKHSIDVLIIELLKIIFWFNPVFILYKKAIQLNHEFLADESVMASCPDVPKYQILILQAIGLPAISITSNFNYSLTKKRLKMMKKHTSRSRIMLIGLALIPLLSILLVLFSNRTIAQSVVPAGQNVVSAGLKKEAVEDGNISKDEYFKGATIWIKNKAGIYEAKKYDEMTAAEKTVVPSVPPLRQPKQVPTEQMMALWKNNPSYKVSIDFKGIKNGELSNYKPDAFVSYGISKYSIPPNKSTNHTSKTQFFTNVSLYTNDFYQKLVITPRIQPGKVLTVGDNYPGIKMHIGPPEPATTDGRPRRPVFVAP